MGQNANEEKNDGQNVSGQKTDRQKTDGQNICEQKADWQKAGGQNRFDKLQMYFVRRSNIQICSFIFQLLVDESNFDPIGKK